MTAMNERDAILCEICEHPGDDGPRLVFADWLVEHGDDPSWAEFIRVQVELARLPAGEERRVGLMTREGELWEEIGERLRAGLPRVPGLSWGRFERGFVGWVSTADGLGALRSNREVFRTRAPVCGLSAEGVGPDELAGLGGHDDPPGLTRLKLAKPGDSARLLALASAPLCPRLTCLDLSGNDLSPDDIRAVADAPAFAGLRRLNLYDNFFDSTAEGLAELLAGSTVLAGLTNLSLEQCWLNGEDALVLARSPNLVRLQRLELHCNELGPLGVRAFTEGPGGWPDLIDLSFGNCGIGDEGADAVAAWPGLSRVRRLDLGGNQISAAFVESLAKQGLLSGIDRIHLFAPTDRSDEVIPGRLSLYHNQMTEAGVEAVLRSPHRGPLASLELWSHVMETSNFVGSVPESLRRFFANDGHVC